MKELEAMNLEDQINQEKKGVGTVRYDEEELDQGSAEETVALFVTGRSKSKKMVKP